MSLQTILSAISSFIWGPPLLILLSGTGLYLTLRLGFLQIRYLPRALGYLFARGANKGKGDVSSFAALCTALAATIGTGNIVGVATAVQAGGPGAIFWMWLVALLGMATKYAECLLAVKYRVRDKYGFMAGGPMYYIERGLGIKWLAKLFALFGVLVAFFGIGTFPQINAITHAMQDTRYYYGNSGDGVGRHDYSRWCKTYCDSFFRYSAFYGNWLCSDLNYYLNR